MCGITGYFGLDDHELLKRMCNCMVHRGPDDAGYYYNPGIGLAMRRLAIIDLKTGHQPISNETQDVWVVFNGEIYNYLELRKNLMALGHIFTTSSDTECIVHLYEEYGLDFIQHLRGMFGIALWDEKKGRLVLVRDRIGEKPLYYSQVAGKLFFGSEIKTILQALNIRSVNHQSVCDFFAAGYVGGDRTFYKEIKKLRPGHMMVCEGGVFTVKQYWRNDFNYKTNISFGEAKVRLEHELDEAVKLCLKSDVEVGAFLSGGIDSSVIVALMRKHNAKVKTFSVGYRGQAEGFNELDYAKRVSKLLGTEHYELILDAKSSAELLPRIIWHYDEPHGEPTSVLVYLLCEFVRKQLKVALGGTGGDELFYGYPKHKGIYYLQYYNNLPGIIKKNLVEKLVSKWPESTKGNRLAKRVKRFVSGGNLPPAEAYLTWVSLLHRDVRSILFSKETHEAVDDPAGEAFLLQYLVGDTRCKDLYDRIAALDIEGYLPEYQLTYMDRMSMANSLEVRSPLIDYKLTEFATSLPVSYRLKGGRSKHILKEVAKKWIPEDIVNRKKVGFDSPIGQWFRDELKSFVKEFLSPYNINKTGLLDPVGVQIVIEDHMSGKKDYSLQLWSILVLEVWYRMYIEEMVSSDCCALGEMRGAVNFPQVVKKG
jgi:asparagine synthase (glutamine-hydrolysing)